VCLAASNSQARDGVARSGRCLGRARVMAGARAGPQRLSDVRRGGYTAHWRIPLAGATGAELSRVLGGGVVPGSLTLVGGDPGVGKARAAPGSAWPCHFLAGCGERCVHALAAAPSHELLSASVSFSGGKR